MVSRSSWVRDSAEPERVLGQIRNNFESQGFCPKPVVTCSIPAESFPMKNGCRKTYSCSAFVSKLTQNKNTEVSSTANPTAKQGLKRQIEDSRNCGHILQNF